MSRYIKGLIRDTSPSDQPEGSWRYARNAVVNRVDGTVGNEEGNKAGPPIGRTAKRIGGGPGTFIKGYKVIGTIEITDDRIVVFSVAANPAESQSLEYGRSEVGVLSPSGGENQELLYKTLLNFPTIEIEGQNCKIIDVSLKFLPKNPISGTYKIDANENLVVYWTDNFNPPRSLNITRQEEAVADTGSYEQLYGKYPANSINKNFIDRLNLFPHAGPVPTIDLQKVISGGGLVSGSYALALAYVDKDLVATNYVVVDNPVSIVDDIESVLPIERYDGAPPGTQTGKSIVWNISDYNTDYDYIRPAIIQHLDGNRFAFQLHDIEIELNGPDFELTFSGTEGYTSSSVDEIVIDTVSYDTVKTITQLDNVLYLGNLTRNLDVGYQRSAGNIKLRPKIIDVSNFDEFSLISDNLEHGFIEMPPLVADKSNGYRDPYNAYKKRGYTRGEVYAFYISFILNDGSMSYAYHIPGRESISTELGPLENSGLYNAGNLNNLGEVKSYHFKSYSEEDGSNDMEYWENSHETYPNTEAFSSDVYKNPNGSAAQVRHHRFPKNDNEAFRVISGSTTSTITTATILLPEIEFEISGGASNNNNIEDTEIVWVLADGTLLGPDSNDFSNEHEAYHVSNVGGLVVGSTYVIAWEVDALLIPNWLGDPGGTYLAECIAIDVDSGWALFDHSQSQMGGFLGEAGFSGTHTDYGYHQTDSNFPNDLNFYNDDNMEGTIYSSPTAGASEAIVSGGTTSDSIRILGFTLDNIKIPASIAKKVQGFRIYYADRQHEDKRILGQGVVTPYDKVRGQLGGCLVNADGTEGILQNFWIKTPLTYNDSYLTATSPDNGRDYQMLAFYNFELLRTQKSISPATHISTQWVTTYHTFKGPGAHHENSNDPCDVEIINSKFFVAESYAFNFRDRYKLLKERCKTYVNGDSILDASGHGFGYKLYNQGGETHIALGLAGNEDNSGFLPKINDGDNNNVIPMVDNPSDYLGVQSSTYTVNLEAFKTDVYNTVDSQNLIWTGFEIKGKNLENFIEDGGGDYAIGSLSGGRSLPGRKGKGKFRSTMPEIGEYSAEAGGIVYAHEYDPVNQGFSYWVFTKEDIHNSEGLSSGQVSGDPGTLDYTYFYSPASALLGITAFNSSGTALSLTGHTDWVVPDSVALGGWSDGFLQVGSDFHDVASDYFSMDVVPDWDGSGFPYVANTVNLGISTIKNHNYIGVQQVTIWDGLTDLSWLDLGTPFGVYAYTARSGHLSPVAYITPFSMVGPMSSVTLSCGTTYDSHPHAISGDGPDNPTINLTGYTEYASSGGENHPVHPQFGWYQNAGLANAASVCNSILEPGDTSGNTNFRDMSLTPSSSVLYPYRNLSELYIAPRYARLKGIRQHFLVPPVDDTVFGCTDSGALNYDPTATVDDGACEYEVVEIDCDDYIDDSPTGDATVILGGDTFICKYGFRQSLTPRISTYLPSDQVSVLYSIIESTDNVNFRHEEDVSTSYFPGSPMQKVALVDRDGKNFDLLNLFDFTGEDKIKYNPDYSIVNNVRPAFVLPNLITAPSVFTTRIQRSTKASRTSLIDNFRIYLSREQMDMPKNRGELWKLSTFNNLLYIHMEDSLLVTKGKQTMAMKDGSEAFIGSGDIFQQDPDELVQTEHGYGGTQSQYSTLVTKYGYFSVDERNKKIFMTTDKMTEISNLGMEKWFYNNLSNDKDSFSTLEFDYAQTLVDDEQYISAWGFRTSPYKDSPIVGKGFVSVWDEKYQRILLTKRALLFTDRGTFLRRKGGRNIPGGIVYNESTDVYSLLFKPSMNLISNGDFSHGNELVENTSFIHTDFTAGDNFPSSFFWLGSSDLVRTLTSNELKINYSTKGYIYQYFTLETGVLHTFELTWKGTNGVTVEVVGVGSILTTNAVEGTLTTVSENFSVPTTKVYELRIHGTSISTSDLYLSGTSLQRVAHPVWELDAGWSIRDYKITNDGTSDGYFSQNTQSSIGDRRLLTFTVQNCTAGTVSVFYGTGESAVRSVFQDGTYTIDDTWKGAEPELAFYAHGGFNGSIDNIEFKTVPEESFTVTDGDFYLDTRTISSDSEALQTVAIPFTSSVSITDINSTMSTRTLPQIGDVYEGGHIFAIEATASNSWTIYLTSPEDLPSTVGDFLPFSEWGNGINASSVPAISASENSTLQGQLTYSQNASQNISTADEILNVNGDYSPAATMALEHYDDFSQVGDWALPTTDLLVPLVDMIRNFYPETSVSAGGDSIPNYWSCDPSSTGDKKLYVVRYLSGTNHDDGSYADSYSESPWEGTPVLIDDNWETFSQTVKYIAPIPLYGHNEAPSWLFQALMQHNAAGLSTSDLLGGYYTSGPSYWESIGIDLMSFYTDEGSAISAVPECGLGLGEGLANTLLVRDYIEERFSSAGVDPINGSYDMIFNAVNLNTPWRHVHTDGDMQVQWFYPSLSEAGYIVKNCTRNPDLNGNAQGAENFISAEHINTATGSVAAPNVTNTISTFMVDGYKTRGIILGTSSFNDSQYGVGGDPNNNSVNSGYFFGVDISRESLRLSGLTLDYSYGPDPEDTIAALAEPGGMPDRYEPTVGFSALRDYENEGSATPDFVNHFPYGRRYVYHQVTILNTSDYPELQNADVGHEFNLNPYTGEISDFTEGVQGVRVFLIETLDQNGDSTGFNGELGQGGGSTGVITHASTVVDSDSSVEAQNVSIKFGVRPVRATTYEEEVIVVPEPEMEIDVIWQRVGWTISFYPELNAWGSLHDYLPHHYTYTSKTFYSFYNWKDFPSIFWVGGPWIGDDADESFTIWAHNSVEAPGSFYGGSSVTTNFTQPFEIEVIENKERDVSKVFSSFKYETEVFEAAVPNIYNLNQVRYKRLDKDGFTQFFVYNNTQHSGVIDVKYLRNIRKIGHMWNINKFRDMARLYETTLDGYTEAYTSTITSGFSGHISSHLLETLEATSQGTAGGADNTGLDFVGNNDVHDMFEATWGKGGAYTIFTHPLYIDSEKPWTKQRKFTDTYLGIRLIHDNINKNFVNLYSTSVAMRKYNR